MKTFEEFQLFDPPLCAYIREMAEHERAHSATIVGNVRNEHNEAVRRATRYKIADPSILNKVLDAFGEWDNWNFCTYWGEEALPLVEAILYKPGDFYKAHTDWSPTNSERKLSMTVQLSGTVEYEGGNVLLHDGPEPHTVYRKQGTACVWPSWTLHEVEPVTSGARWALVAWMLGPDFN